MLAIRALGCEMILAAFSFFITMHHRLKQLLEGCNWNIATASARWAGEQGAEIINDNDEDVVTEEGNAVESIQSQKKKKKRAKLPFLSQPRTMTKITWRMKILVQRVLASSSKKRARKRITLTFNMTKTLSQSGMS